MKQEATLILLDSPIIVNDEEIKENDLFISLVSNTISTPCTKQEAIYCKGLDAIKKVIAQESQIDWNGLESEFGYVDVNKLALDFSVKDGCGNNTHIKHSYCVGFLKHKELTNKMFSEEDMIDFLQFYKNTARLDFNSTGENHGKSTKELLQIWQQQRQPKQFKIEVEIVDKVKILKKI